MGLFIAGGKEQAPTVRQNVFGAAVADAVLTPVYGSFNFSLLNTVFVGTVILEKSFDGGATFVPAKDANNNVVTLAAPGTFSCNEVEAGVLYRANCTAFTSGAPTSRISGGPRQT